EDLDREFRKQGVLANDDALPAWDPRKEVTTQAKYQQERRISGFARDGRGKQRPVVTGLREVRTLLRAWEARQDGITLTDQQEKAIIGLAGSRNAVNVVDAGQGTGKTEMLAAFADILSSRQAASTWLGTTHTAVGELTSRGLPAMTVAHFLNSPAEQEKAAGSRIIVDEASMLAQEDAYRLCLYAEANGCRIDFVGDSKQYKSPVAGDTMRLLTSRFTGVVPITMTKTMRQQGRLKQAMEHIRDGKELQGHDILSELGMVHELPLDRLSEKAAELYLQWSAKGDQVPVISPTHAQADEIAAKIRQGLRARGDLKGKEHTLRRLFRLDWSPPQIEEARAQGAGEEVVLTQYGAYLEQTQQLSVGDLVRATMGGTTKDGHRLVNGTRYRIKAFTETGDPVLNNGWVVDKDWGGLVQNYVSTGQGAQGRTAQRAVVVYGTPSLVATRKEGFYVPVSRVRQEVAVLTDSNTALREAIQRQESRKLASELVEARQRQRMPLRQRLGKHFAYVRRLASFAWLHQRETRQPQREPSVQRRIEYGR
ncbi:MAG TPA: AAA family ATPase, partial [Gemmataceae bacterium]|nr:AAA family ATPase [Gemmataceae bacterium]